MDATIYHAWILTPEVVEGRRFVDIYISYRARQYLDGHHAMLDHIRKLRDAKAKEAMRGLANQEDPNDRDSISPAEGAMTRPMRELIDRIPKILDLSVMTRNGFEATVSVLPSWREKGVLQIELTKENMDLLLEDPPAVSAPFTPKISHPDVYSV